MIIQLAGGEAANGVVDAYPGRVERQPILFSTEKIKPFLGVDFGIDEVVNTLISRGAEGCWGLVNLETQCYSLYFSRHPFHCLILPFVVPSESAIN